MVKWPFWSFYLYDKCLSENFWGCLHVADKGIVPTNVDELINWDSFQRLWGNSSNKCPKRLQGGCTVDLLDTMSSWNGNGNKSLKKARKSKSEIFLGKLFNFDVDHLHIDHMLLTVKHSPVSRSLWPGWLWWTAADSSHSRCSEWKERKVERTEQLNWSGHW